MRLKKMKIFLMCIVGTMALIGCASKESLSVSNNNQNVVSKEEDEVSQEEKQRREEDKRRRQEIYESIGAKQYLITYYGFTEAELEGYDVDAFVCKWVVDVRDEPEAEFVRNCWEGKKSRFEKNDDYMIYHIFDKDSERKLTKEDHVVKIQVFSQVGNEPGHSVVADVEKGVFYVDDTTPHAMDDMMKMRLKDITNQYDVESWQSSYECYDDSTAYVGWEVRFLLDTGEVCVYSGGGASFSGFHDEIMEIVGCYRDLLDSVGIRG